MPGGYPDKTEDGETRIPTGDTTIFRDADTGREESQESCKSAGRGSYALRVDTCAFPWLALG